LRVLSALLATLLIGGAAEAQSARAPYDPATMVPARAALYVEIARPTVLIKTYGDSALARIFAEPSVQKFLAPLLAQLEAKKRKLEDSLGIKIEEALGLLSSPVAAFYVHHPAKKKGFRPGKNIVAFARCSDTQRARLILSGLHKPLGAPLKVLTHAGYAYWKLSDAENPSVFALVPGMIVWAGSEAALKTLLEEGLGKGPSLADEPAFKRLRRQTPRPSAGYLIYADVARSAVALTPTEEPMKTRIARVMKVLGGYDLTHVLLVGKSSLDGGIHDVLVLDAPKKKGGLLGLSGDKPVTNETLALIPQDVNSFGVFSFKFARIYDLVFEVLGSLGVAEKEKARNQLAEFEKKCGFSVREELVETFASRVITYSRFAREAGLLSSLAGQAEKVLAIEMKNPQRAREIVNRLIEMNPEVIRRKFDNDYRGVRITKVLFSARRMPLEINFAVTGGYLIVSNELASIMELIDRLSGREKTASVLEHEMFKDCMKRLTVSGEKVAVFYTDVQKNFKFLYSILRTVLRLAALNKRFETAPVDLASVPPVEDISKHLFGACFVIYKVDDGLVLEHFSPIGGANVLMGLAAVGASFFFPYNAHSTPTMKDKCRDHLHALYKVLVEYAEKHDGRTPSASEAEAAKLGEKSGESVSELKGLAGNLLLVKEKGLVFNTNILYCPYQGDKRRFGYVIVPGVKIKGYASPSQAILAYDHPDNHPDLTRSVLFADGSVRTVTELKFQKLMIRQSVLQRIQAPGGSAK